MRAGRLMPSGDVEKVKKVKTHSNKTTKAPREKTRNQLKSWRKKIRKAKSYELAYI